MIGHVIGFRSQRARFRLLPTTLVILCFMGIIYTWMNNFSFLHQQSSQVLPVCAFNSSSLSSASAIPSSLNEKLNSTKCKNCTVLEELKIIYQLLFYYREQYDVDQDIKNNATCPAIPPKLIGSITVFHNHFPVENLNELGFHVSLGGSYEPTECTARQRVAIIIPYRNREEHLSTLLLNLHPFLQKQQLEYTIFVVNQEPGSKFNRGVLLNIGFVEAEKRKKYDCVIFHDVDLLPEHDSNMYNCSEDAPRHMASAIDKYGYKQPYKAYAGGVVGMPWNLFVKMNGYSNQFFGWGGEDDDFYKRCKQVGYNITRYPASISRYKMARHGIDPGNEKNPARYKMLRKANSRQWRDGLNSLKYKIKSIEDKPLFTLINVEINQTQVMNAETGIRERFPFELEKKS